MAAPGPAPAPRECHLQNLMLPKNDANTCWWLSANLALFHKVRPEIDAYLYPVPPSAAIPIPAVPSTTKDPAKAIFDGNLSGNFQMLQNYYSGAGSNQPTMSNLIELRLGSNMATVFNSSQFQVDGANTQSSDEYIATLSKYVGFDKGLVPINTGSELGAFPTSGYDLYLHATHFGMPRTNSDTKSLFYSQVGSDVNTIILTFGRNGTKGKTSIPILPLKQITLPTFNLSNLMLNTPYSSEYIGSYSNFDATKANMQQFPYTLSNLADFTDTSTFYLDAMIVYEPGHYVSYVKCEESEAWYYYKAIKEGTLGDSNAGNKSFTTFEDMMSKDGKAISLNFTHLLYSKVQESM